MTETQCSKQIYANWSRHPCSRKGIVEREGKFYCKQHDPVRIKDQEEKQNRKWDQEWAEAKAKRDHINACVRAIESIGGDPGIVGELVSRSRQVIQRFSDETVLDYQREALYHLEQLLDRTKVEL